jgi:septum formation protein
MGRCAYNAPLNQPFSDHIHVTKPLLYLASASPRRRELLAQVGIEHLCLPQFIDESPQPGEPADVYVERLAREKALRALDDPDYFFDELPILAADTTVALDGEILGKPTDAVQGRVMLRRLSDVAHEVLTGIAVVTSDGSLQSRVVRTSVSFRPLEEPEVLAYWASGEPSDKAGAYAIQGRGAIFVRRIEGSYSNVVGLPLFETMELLERHGITSALLLNANGVS